MLNASPRFGHSPSLPYLAIAFYPTHPFYRMRKKDADRVVLRQQLQSLLARYYFTENKKIVHAISHFHLCAQQYSYRHTAIFPNAHHYQFLYLGSCFLNLFTSIFFVRAYLPNFAESSQHYIQPSPVPTQQVYASIFLLFSHHTQEYITALNANCHIHLLFPTLTILCHASSHTFFTILRTFGFLQKIKKGKQVRGLPYPSAILYKGQALRVFAKRFLHLKYMQKLFPKNLDTMPRPL